MARFSVFSIALIVVVFLFADALGQRPWCRDSVECRTKYCRDGRCIRYGDDPNDVGVNPCSLVRCAGYCVLEQVQCVWFPCPPAARCVTYPHARY